jgi:hypothetical protein
VEPPPDPTEFPTDLAPFLQPWTGDLDGMLERRMVRILTVRDPVLYYMDKGREVGITYETAKQFEAQLNKLAGNPRLKIHVMLLPVRHDELLPRLLAGEGDIVASLKITPERQAQVDFAKPFVGERSRASTTCRASSCSCASRAPTRSTSANGTSSSRSRAALRPSSRPPTRCSRTATFSRWSARASCRRR